ncbi:MAG: HD domain-containing protein [Clostridiales bacterium]|nr:HD domain-containing protein [Clostridiales bacterium]
MSKHANYFEFTPAEREYLESVNRMHDEMLSVYAAKNEDAVRNKTPRYDIIRPSYSYDADYIIHCPLYNRYADKTQVFSFYKNDDLTRRALHVQFVSKIARTIGRALKLNLQLIEAISLGHDMGHPPFGHKGEEFLSECYCAGTEAAGVKKRYFNHNVHSARIFRYILDNRLTLQTLSGIISHNGEKVCCEYSPAPLSDFQEFDALLENCYTDNNYHKKLRPNTLEGCVVRISDMIAYAGKDRQDLYRAKLITDKKFKEKRLIGTANSDIISNLVANIIKNSINSPSLNMDTAVFDDLKDLINENYEIIYKNKELNEPYYESVRPLMHGLYERLCLDVEERNFDSPVFRHYLNNPIYGRAYREDKKANGKITADKNEIVTDFIASMTDDYFIDISAAMHIDDKALSKIKYHEYFKS